MMLYLQPELPFTPLLLLLPLAAGFLLDLLIGDPYALPHPIRLIGKAIEAGEKLLRRWFPNTEKGQLAAGGVLGIFIPLLAFACSFFLLYGAYSIHLWLGVGLETLMCYQILAVKALKQESMKVYYALKEESLSKAREKIAMIVGRDTENLNEEQIAKAAVETVAENTSDGTVAPLLFMAVGGAPFGFLYKAINTLDSMIGYKNDNYLFFGRFSAKLDDVANFIPARISALLMILASLVLGMDYQRAYAVFRRDRFNHASPNSAQTESVCAGALGIQLAGDAYYFGKRYPKKTIGDKTRTVSYQDIAAANRLLYATAVLSLITAIVIRLACCLSIGCFTIY